MTSVGFKPFYDNDIDFWQWFMVYRRSIGDNFKVKYR